MRTIFSFIMLLILISASNPSYAELSKKEAINKIERHLNEIGTLKANFTQISADGGVSNGTFFLARPGKLRWQYDPPVPLLIVGNGSEMQYQDLELDTISRVNMDETLAGLMAREDIEVDNGDVEVKNFSDEAGVLRLTIIKKDKPKDGSLTLVFDDSPMALRKLEVVDAANQKTVISLSNLMFDIDLDAKLFELR